MIIKLCGDEFLCLQEYKKIKEKSNPLSCPSLVISRDPDQEITRNTVVIYPNKVVKDAKVFEYIDEKNISLLKKILGKDESLFKYVPLNYFSDLKNSQYTVVAYDLMTFYSSVYPILNTKHTVDINNDIFINVFDFIDDFLALKSKLIFSKYKDTILQDGEVFWWVFNNTIDVCFKILFGSTTGIHPYRVQKYTPLAKNLKVEGLCMFKEYVNDMIRMSRDGSNDADKMFRTVRLFSCIVK